MRQLTFILLIFFIIVNSSAISSKPINKDNISQGLYFLSYEVQQEERTGLNLTPECPLDLKDKFTLEFDLKLRSNIYGCIFRIVLGDIMNINLFTICDDSNFFTLSMNNKVLSKIAFDNVGFSINEWSKVRITVNYKTQQLQLSVNGRLQNIKTSLCQTNNIRLLFGANNYLHLFNIDVAPMVIRNINIYNASNKLVRSWELRQHNINEVFDTITYQKAIALNGVWEVDKHAKWKKLTSFKIKGLNPQIAYDKRNGLIFVVKNEFLYKYSLVLNKVDTLRTLNGNPYSSITNNLIYNLLSNKLISYRVGTHLFSEYDFQNNSWSQSAEGLNDKAMLHNSVIAEDRDELITFGGYGFHLYNAVLTKYALSNNSMKSKDISTFIEPRYLSSADYCGNGELYVLGGYGCKTGIQDGFTQNYYDLHLINTDSMTCRKLWEFKNDNQFFTFSKSMVIDKEHKYLYSLTYENDKRNTSVQLVRFGLNSPDKKVFADTISYRFHDLSSFCDLFRNEGSNELIAILLYLENNETVINFYSLPLPPLNEADTIQPISKSSSWPWRIPIFVMLIVIVLFIGYYIVNRKEKKKTIFPEDLSPVENKGIIKHAPAIYLLGGLQIIDTQGNDITGRFTSTTKSLFLIILLKSLQNGEGITSQFIDDTLWFNMYKDSAINNRNVNMRKLRLLLKELGSVTISNDNSYWRLDLGEEVYCDYKEVLRLINEIKTRQYNKINKALDIVIKGNLLPDANYEWIDNYKSDYSNLIINVLSEISKYPEIKKDLKLLLRISNAMLAQDAIDEDAISLKCYALYHLGKKGLALATFNNFSEKYKKILSSTPKIEFEEIIKD